MNRKHLYTHGGTAQLRQSADFVSRSVDRMCGDWFGKALLLFRSEVLQMLKEFCLPLKSGQGIMQKHGASTNMLPGSK